MLRKVRIVSQIIFFAGFLAVFFLFEYVRLKSGVSGLAWYLRLNPLSVLITSVASRTIVIPYLILGLVMLVITLLFGRVFCGMMCPLGGIIDLTDRVFRSKQKARQAMRPPLQLQKLKYIFLFSIVTLSIAGVTFPLFMDPLCIVPRVFGTLIRPFIYLMAGMFKIGGDTILESPLRLNGPFIGSFTTFILFTAILMGAMFDRRFWCQYICPSGAFFGIMSRFSLFTRKTVKEKCNACKLCSKITCPTGAISEENVEKTSTAECILCGNCSTNKRMCSSFSFGRPLPATTAGPDISRRSVLGGIVSALVFIPVVSHRSYQRLWLLSMKRRFNPGPLRPPGAIEENEFLSRCITCGACISVCPENALHPCTIAADGFTTWNTPKLVPRLGYCRKDCTRCTEACPTGALLPVKIADKPKIKIGTAVIDRSRCRPWLGQLPCLICQKNCPYEAITVKTNLIGETEWDVPEVNKFKCVGCGVCEHLCPVQQESAIQVFSIGEKRIVVREVKKK